MIQKTPSMNKVQGFYLGKVLMHLNHGMIKVFIPGVYPIEWQDKPELLPNCIQVVQQFGGNCNGNGVFSYPNIGSTVVCFFANGDQNMPITIGSVLGGENAFGQYELIKEKEESISERHLITSGKSQFEMYESGKISAVVEDPIRTEASVEYHNEKSILSVLSTDSVSARISCDAIDKNELSNVHCSFVLDNKTADGRIFQDTHRFLNTNISNDQMMLTEKMNYDNIFQQDNAGNVNMSITSVLNRYENDKQQDIKTLITSEASLTSNKVLNDGFDNISKYNLDKTVTVNNQTANWKIDNNLTASFYTSEKMKSDIHIKADKKFNNNDVYNSEGQFSIDGVQSTIDLNILNNLDSLKCQNKMKMDSTIGQLEISIKDLKTGSSCVFILDKSGDVNINASKSLTIVAPEVEITGTTHVTGTLTVTQDITGEMDVIASNCTLNRHVHVVPPHCPSVGLTRTGR